MKYFFHRGLREQLLGRKSMRNLTGFAPPALPLTTTSTATSICISTRWCSELPDGGR